MFINNFKTVNTFENFHVITKSCVTTINLEMYRVLLKTIRKRQMEFLVHVCRRRGLKFLSLTGKVEGKRDRGKQRITFLDSLCNSATGGQSKAGHTLHKPITQVTCLKPYCTITVSSLVQVPPTHYAIFFLN